MVCSCFNPCKVALALFNKLFEPICFAKTFLIPAISKTVRIELPAITPEPGADGFIITLQAPYVPLTKCVIVSVFVIGIVIKFFLPFDIALFMAFVTSFAFPIPIPTSPLIPAIPTTTTALKLSFLPPLTTFETRFI
jgi:hypothetical protein